MPALPWYTWLTLALVLLMLAGLVRTCLLLVMRGLLWIFRASWMSVNLFMVQVLGWSLSSYGTAHWASYLELRRAGVFSATTGIPIGMWKERPLYENRGGHVALFGPPRSRKSWGLIMPAITSYSGSVIVSDLRGELHQRTAAQREMLGPIFRFAPAEPTSCSLNLLDAIRWGTQFEFGDLHRVLDHLVMVDAETRGNPFAIAAVPLLLSVVMHCHLTGHGHFPGVLDWLLDPARDIDEKLDELLASAHPLVQVGGRRLMDMSERLRMSVWNAGLASLTIFQDTLIASHTSKSDFDLGALLFGVQPISLYLALGFADIARLGTFLGVFVEVLVARLGSPETPPRHKVLLALDEMANLGKLVELEKSVSYLQGSGTQCLFTFQNVPQVLDLYGETSPLLASVSTVVHYTPAPFDALTAGAIATALGTTSVVGTVAAYPESHTTAGLAPTNVSAVEHQRALLTPDEIARLPETDALILLQGCAPVRAQKLGAPPLTRAQRVNRFAYGHRYSLATGTALLLVTLALWPLYTVASRLQLPTLPTNVVSSLFPYGQSAIPRPPPALPVTAPPPVVTPGPWHLLESSPLLMQEGIASSRGSFPTQDACRAGLVQQYTSTIAQVRKMVRPPNTLEISQTLDRWEWSTHRGRQPLASTMVWCEARQ